MRTSSSARDGVSPIGETAVVLGLAVVALAVDVHYARRWHLGFDEAWHVFASIVEPLRQFVAEIRGEAHPPLHYVILRMLHPVGEGLLRPRLASIVPGVASVVLGALCLRALRVGTPLVLLGALAFAIAPAAVNIAVCVRAYSLATMFTLLACLALFRLVRTDDAAAARRHGRRFVAAILLATASEYSAMFVAVGAVAAFAVLAATARERGWPFLRARFVETAVLGLGLGAALGYRRWTEVAAYNHVTDLFRQPAESLGAFALRGVAANLSALLAPLAFPPTATTAVGLALVAAALLFLLVIYVAPTSAARDPARAAVLVIHGTVWFVLFAAALVHLYPFGGRMRHQFVLFPFLVLTAALVLDEIGRIAPRPVRWLLPLALAVPIAAGARQSLTTSPLEEFPPVPLWQASVREVRAALAPGDAIYTGTYNQIGLFKSMRDCRWTHRDRRDDRLDRFTAECGGRAVDVVRDQIFWTLPLPADAGLLAGVATVARQRADAGLWVVAMPPGGFERAAVATPDAEERVRRLCGENGLVLTRYLVLPDGVAFRVEAAP